MLNQSVVYSNHAKLFVDVMTFGEWLRLQIKNTGLSNAEVARRAKLSPTYIGNLVRDFSPNTKDGKGRPSEEVVAEIAKAVSGNLNEARLAAGYAPEGDFTKDSHEILEGVTINFQDGGKLSKKKQKEILNAARLIVRGVMTADDEEEN